MKAKLFSIKKVLFIVCVLSVIGVLPLHRTTAVDVVLDDVVVTPDKGFTALAPIPGLTDTAITSSSGFADFFNKLYVYLIGAAVILAIIMIIWGGLEYSTQDSISKKSDGKSKIYNALFGLVLVLSPVLVFTIINPAILNLNVNFPALQTKWESYSGAVSCVGNYCTTTWPGGDAFAGTIDPCTTKAECDAIYDKCQKDGKTQTVSIACKKADGTLGGRQDWRIDWSSTYSCASGETLVVACDHTSANPW